MKWLFASLAFWLFFGGATFVDTNAPRWAIVMGIVFMMLALGIFAALVWL